MASVRKVRDEKSKLLLCQARLRLSFMEGTLSITRSLALGLCLLMVTACGDRPETSAPVSAQVAHHGLLALDEHSKPATAVDADLSKASNEDAEATQSITEQAPAEAGTADGSIGLKWRIEPPVLRVYQSTAVHLQLVRAPKGHEAASCRWNFGDGSPISHGCNVSHTYHGGQADQVVTLTLTDGDWTWESTRTVPLERLSVTKMPSEQNASGGASIPDARVGDANSFRFSVIADSAASDGVPRDVGRAVASLASRVKPELVLHVGGIVTKDSELEAQKALDAMRAPLEKVGAKVTWALSPTDRSAGLTMSRPSLQMIDGKNFPERYSFTYKGAFFLVFSSHPSEGVTDKTLQWLRGELAKARVYEARYVVTYLPLHKFAEDHLGSLDQKFRLYELFLRGRVTTLFTGAYRVYFKGRYGALPVVSVGPMSAPGGRLSGSAFEQESSFVVVDHHEGVLERIFAVAGPTFDRVVDETRFPDAVEVYTR